MSASRLREQRREAFCLHHHGVQCRGGVATCQEQDMGKSAARAISEKMSRQHVALERSWKALPDRLKADQVDQPALLHQLQQLHQQLAEHFRFEEADGYFDEVVAKAPHLQREADRLRGQHTEMIGAVVRLLETADRIGADPKQLAAVRLLFEDLSKVFHEHETDEGRLLEDAYWRETTAVD
jgi:hypothetical protein